MNDTNRALNRVLLAIVALAALTVSAAAVLLVAVPTAPALWAAIARQVVRTSDRAFGASLGPGVGLSAAALIALGVAVVFVLLLVAFIVRQGRGATSTVVTVGTDAGSAEIDVAVPAALLADRLSAVPGVAAANVSAYRVRTTPAVKVTVRCRRGASPRLIADALDEAVGRLHGALGVPLPVFAQLVGGFRARLRPAVRVDTSTSATRPS